MTVERATQLAFEHYRAGRAADAEAVCLSILARFPNHAETLHILGSIAFSAGRHSEACDLFQRSVSADPSVAARRGDLAFALFMLGRHDEAIEAARAALQRDSSLYEAHNVVGLALRETGRFAEAADEFKSALRINPAYLPAQSNLAYTLEQAGELDAAAEQYRAVIASKPDFAEAYVNLGNIYQQQGDINRAIEQFRIAATLNPRLGAVHDNLLYALHFSADHSPREILEEHVRWHDLYMRSNAQPVVPPANKKSPTQRLRIGYVAPDFREHAQSFFTVPLLSHHDHEQFEITCYASVRRPDSVTARLRAYADRWRDIVRMSDDEAADLIRQDGVDILVDLTLHMAANRLPIFARKPAPVQVTWLGYPGTTGLRTIDYRLTDAWLDPPGTSDEFYTEKSIRLPDSFWCYDPLTDEPDVSPSPAATNGNVTFGCLNSFAKVNEGVLRAWAQVLERVKGSRMLILCPRGQARERVLGLFKSAGVDAQRIELLDKSPRRQYLDRYHSIDISLDTFPYNGHTTSLDSLWSGVPVVSLTGQTAVARGGLSILSNVGLPELVGQSLDEYVRIAVELANDLPRLANLRATLRPRMQASPLMDAPRFARSVEAIYRMIWER